MKLLTKNILKQLPAMRSTEGEIRDQVKIIVKFFTPDAQMSWYATEYDPNRGLFFGFVNLGHDDLAELGCFSLAELEEFRGRLGLKVERDRWFESNLADVMAFVKR